MTLWVTVFSTNLSDLSLILETHTVEGEANLWPAQACHGSCMSPLYKTNIKDTQEHLDISIESLLIMTMQTLAAHRVWESPWGQTVSPFSLLLLGRWDFFLSLEGKSHYVAQLISNS